MSSWGYAELSSENLLSDAMWDYTWDAENRLTAMQLKSAANLPIMQIVFAYDHMGRRIRKMLQTTLQAAQHYDNGATQLAWSTSYDHRYLYQGPAEWLLGATMVVDEYSNMYDQQLFAWGVDLLGSEQGAGGMGGLDHVPGHRWRRFGRGGAEAAIIHFPIIRSTVTCDTDGHLLSDAMGNSTCDAHFGATTAQTSAEERRRQWLLDKPWCDRGAGPRPLSRRPRHRRR